MNVTFRQLRLFLELANQRSISGVARHFQVTQPTVSMQMRELSDEVGLPLYEVIGKRLYLTSAGQELARAAQVMEDEWQAYEQCIAGMKGLTCGQLSIAVVSTAKYFMPRLLGAFSKMYPEVDIALEVQNREGILRRLRENRDDFCIMSIPPDDIDIVRHTLMPNPLVMVASQTHAFAGQQGLRLEQFCGERFILREAGSCTRLACDRHFASHDFLPQIRMALGSNEAIKQAVAGDLGLSVLSRHALNTNLQDHALAILDVQDFPLQENWFAVHLQGKRLSPVARGFLDYLQQNAGQAVAAA